MISLNDIIENYINANSQNCEGKYFTSIFGGKIVINKDLYNNPPIKYNFDSEKNIFKALMQFDAELMDADPKEILFQTKLENKLQRPNIFHNGKKIPEESLNHLNKYLDWIAKDRIDWNQLRHGNLIAGQMLKSISGRIHLENLNNEKYNVKTSVEFPFE